MTTKLSFVTEGYKRTFKTVSSASQDIVKLINVTETNHKDKLLEEELKELREARYLIDHASTLIAHANQIHYMRMIK